MLCYAITTGLVILEKRRLRRAVIADLGRDYSEDYRRLFLKVYEERAKISEHTLQQGTRVFLVDVRKKVTHCERGSALKEVE